MRPPPSLPFLTPLRLTSRMLVALPGGAGGQRRYPSTIRHHYSPFFSLRSAQPVCMSVGGCRCRCRCVGVCAVRSATPSSILGFAIHYVPTYIILHAIGCYFPSSCSLVGSFFSLLFFSCGADLSPPCRPTWTDLPTDRLRQAERA